MKDFFNVSRLEQVLELRTLFGQAGLEDVDLEQSHGRVLSINVPADRDLPDFTRSTMDGYAVKAASTFGASGGTPALLSVMGTVAMGERPDFSIGHGEAVRISTGGMLPHGADSVVMVEYTEALDGETIEVYRSVAPGHNIMEKGEDYKKDDLLLEKGRTIKPQDAGLLAAFGYDRVPVYKKPRIGIVSTGDEIVDVSVDPPLGHIRDMNTHTLRGLVLDAGGEPVSYGIVKDDEAELASVCGKALNETDMVLISGGSSVGARDYTTRVLMSFPSSTILVHGISISPGKPTILASVSGKAVWGLPGHVVSAMIVFDRVVKPFIRWTAGCVTDDDFMKIPAILSRNVASAQGREEFIRVRLEFRDGEWLAVPVLGKSGAINTMVLAHGLIRIPMNTEGFEQGSRVNVLVSGRI